MPRFAAVTRAAAVAAGAAVVVAGSAASASAAPTSFALPTGFQPEGIDTGTLDGRPYAFVTSLADGSVYRADLTTGQGAVLSPPAPSSSIGAELDKRGRLFVATGPGNFVNGDAGAGARIIDARTGGVLASYKLTKTGALVNDVTVTAHAAWFTDTLNPVVYELPLGPEGQLPRAGQIRTIRFTGDDRFDDRASTVDGNGISSTPDGKALIVINYRTGRLFKLDPTTGATRRIVVQGGRTFPKGDGLTLVGRRLYVPQNNNKISVLDLDAQATRARLATRLRSPSFDGPTNVAPSGDRLWTVSARFGLRTPRLAPFTVSSVPQP